MAPINGRRKWRRGEGAAVIGTREVRGWLRVGRDQAARVSAARGGRRGEATGPGRAHA
jgi:hypothetical protein